MYVQLTSCVYGGDLTNRRKLFSIPIDEHAPFSHQGRTRKASLLGLISNISKYCFKTGTIWRVFLTSNIFTALEFDSNHFGVVLWKKIKPREPNEVKPPIGKIFRKHKPIRHYFVMTWKQLSCSLVNKVYGNDSKVSYLQRNIKCYNLETTFQKKVKFSQ